ncbi:hypothetical protein HZS_6700 [Henneguya salminicola]|nr:hypothetical protein HZS_6700 [Henneguya salminicola]
MEDSTTKLISKQDIQHCFKIIELLKGTELSNNKNLTTVDDIYKQLYGIFKNENIANVQESSNKIIKDSLIHFYEYILNIICNYINEEEKTNDIHASYILSVSQQSLISFFFIHIAYVFIALKSRPELKFIFQYFPSKFSEASSDYDSALIRTALTILIPVFESEELRICTRPLLFYIIFGLTQLLSDHLQTNVEKVWCISTLDHINSLVSTAEIVEHVCCLQNRAKNYMKGYHTYQDQLNDFIFGCGILLSKILLAPNGLRIILSVMFANKIDEEEIAEFFSTLLTVLPKQCSLVSSYADKLTPQLISIIEPANDYKKLGAIITRSLLAKGSIIIKNHLLIELFNPLLLYEIPLLCQKIENCLEVIKIVWLFTNFRFFLTVFTVMS